MRTAVHAEIESLATFLNLTPQLPQETATGVRPDATGPAHPATPRRAGR